MLTKFAIAIISFMMTIIFASPTLAQMDTKTCNALTGKLEVSQADIDHTRDAYDNAAKNIDEKISAANEAFQKDENLDVIWGQVMAARDKAKPRAQEALRTLNAGFELMHTYIDAGCTTITAEEIERRREVGASRYEKGLEMLDALPTDWHERYRKPADITNPALCKSLEEQRKKADAAARAHSLKYDDLIAAYRKTARTINEAIDLERPFDEKWEALLATREAALPGVEGYAPLIRAMFAPVEKAYEVGCSNLITAPKEAFEQNKREVLKDIAYSYARMSNMPLKAADYLIKRRQTTTPRVGIINETDQVICIHKNAKPKGNCVIKPHGTRIVELMEKNGDAPIKTLLITGGTHWLKSADGNAQAKDLKVCVRRDFEHKTGSKAWVIKEGVEEGCTLPKIAEQ